MLLTIAAVLVVLWLLGIVTAYTLGGFIHILLVVAIILVLIRIIQGKTLSDFAEKPPALSRRLFVLHFFSMQHVIRTQQFTRSALEKLFALADTLERERDESLKGKILATLFYEPSTRTRFSFESAMLRLGGEVLSMENAGISSSSQKGETLEDTIRVVNYYSDIIALRHPEEGAADRASKVSRVPIINAGDGTGQHPTQALLDVYTIYRERGKIDGTHIVIVGNLKYYRAARSLSYLLGKFDDIRLC